MDQKQVEEFEAYCESCESCGEEGCCPRKKCLYLEQYHKDLVDENSSLKERIEDLILEKSFLERELADLGYQIRK